MTSSRLRLGEAFMKILVVLAVSLAATPSGLAQTTSASVSGSVQDAQGAGVPGATVTITSETQETQQVAKTDRLGNFLFAFVRPDTYTLAITLEGFQRVEQPGLLVNANDRLAAGRFTLAVGKVNEEVVVTGSSSEIKLRGGERAFTLQSTAMQNMGVGSRSYFGLAAMAPGVVPSAAFPTAVSAFNVNGQRANSNNVTIDGVANIDTGDNGGNMVLTVTDAIAEVKVLTSSYQAEYGRAVGGQVQVVTKSGAREFRGSAYWYGNRAAWNANTWTNNRDGIPKENTSRNDTGYTIGGPVTIPGLFNEDRKKLFFFWNQEFQRRKNVQTEKRATVPTALERKGDFSQSVDVNGNPYPYIRDYTTNLPCGPANTSGCFKYQGVLGRIDPARLYQPTLAALSLFPLPNASAGVGYNYTSQKPPDQPFDLLTLRSDYQATDRWRLTGRYMQHKNRNVNPYGLFGSSNVDNATAVNDTPGRNWLASAAGVLNNTTAIELSVGSGHNSIDQYPISDVYSLSRLTSQANGQSLPMLNYDALRGDNIPTFTFGGGRVGSPASLPSGSFPFSNFNTTYDLLANLTKVAGAHSLKAGLYYQRSLKDQSAFSNFNGTYAFNNDANNPYDSSHPFANAALGIYSAFTQGSAYAKPKWRYTNLEWYVQDSWRTTNKLTLEYGVRFYYLTPQWDASKIASNWLPDKFSAAKAVRLYQPAVVNGVRVGYDQVSGTTVPTAFIGRVVNGSGDRFNGAYQAGQGISETLTDGNKFRVSPRLGFAYDLTGAQRFVVRGGFSLLYDRPQGNQVFDLINNPPGIEQQQLTWGLVSQVGQGGGTPIYSPLALAPNVYEWKPPKVYQWNAAFQAQLPAQFVLDVGYVGSESRDLLQLHNVNPVSYGAAYNHVNWDPTRGRTCSGCPPLSAIPGANALPVDFLRPYPGFGNIKMWEFGAYSSYRSVQTSLSRRLSRGLMVNGYYAWSSAKGLLAGTDWDYIRIDGRTREVNYGPLSYDRPHIVKANFVYQFPVDAKGPLGFLVNGWQVSGSYAWMMGTPATATYSIPGIGNVNLTGSYTEAARIALTGEAIGSGWSSDPYKQFNVAAFTAPLPGSIGMETQRYTMRNPPANNLNASVSKSFPLGGHRRFEIRLDAFNALNMVQFATVNQTLNFASLTDHTVTNLPYDPTGKLVNKYGVGTVASVQPARQVQLMTRFTF